MKEGGQFLFSVHVQINEIIIIETGKINVIHGHIGQTQHQIITHDIRFTKVAKLMTLWLAAL
jgi:hypothetical protein